jgi:hypothetical protein
MIFRESCHTPLSRKRAAEGSLHSSGAPTGVLLAGERGWGRGKPLATILALLTFLSTPAISHATEVQLHQQLQSLPIAGFQYYAGLRVWDQLKLGDPLKLTREADNPHDPNAVRIEWNGEKLGYVPRAGNDTVAKLMDKGVPVSGRITYLQKGRSAWQRIQFEVLLDQ